MSNAVFPALSGVAWAVTKTPQWSNRVQRSTGGMELRAAYYSLPIWKWRLTFNFLSQVSPATDFATLAGFYNARQGMFDTFLYDDPTDDLIPSTAPMAFGTGDGTTTAFQLVRTLGSAAAEPVYNLNATPVIYKNGVVFPPGYTITNGLVTFTVAPALGVALTWSGSYYWRCRFDQDAADFENFASLLWAQKGLTFVSVKGS
jgi:uncharacterized protein (TIGR02217 family)